MKFATVFWLRFTLILCYALGVNSQTVYHDEMIRFYQGLPSDIVLKTQIDADGFLYVSTAKGLSRYDGYRFTNQPNVNSNIFDFVYAGSKIYFHDSKHGLAKVDDIFAKSKVLCPNSYEDVNPNNDHFENIYVDSGKRVWCSDFNNLKYFSDENKKVHSFPFHPNNKSNNINVTFLEASPSEVWAFTGNGVFVWDKKIDILKPHPNVILSKILCKSALQINKDEILVATEKRELYIYKISTSSLDLLQTSKQDIIGLVELPDGIPAFYTRESIYAVQKNCEMTPLYLADKFGINHVSADRRTKNLWVATNKGLLKLSPIEGVENYKLPPQGTDRKIISLSQDSYGTIWMLDDQNSVWSKNKAKQWQQYHFSGNRKLTLLSIYKNEIFATSENELLHLENNAFVRVKLPGFLPNGIFKKVLLTTTNELWLLCVGTEPQCYTWPGLEKIDRHFSNEPIFWTENTWNDLYEAGNGKIWLCGWAPKSYGICFYDVGTNKFIDISDLPMNANRDKFFGDYVNRIARGPGKRILFSGYGGFCMVEDSGNVVRKVDITAYPIANGHLEGIGYDGNDNVVFATGDGLHVYNQKRNDIIRISQADGLPADDLVYGFLKLADGKFALGVDNGFSIVDVKRILTPKNFQGLHLSNVLVDGKLRPSDQTNIEMSKDENDMTLSFSDLSYIEKQKVFYRYRFGDEERWNYLGNRAELTLNHIEPGKYKLIIQSGNNLGQWQSRGLEIKLLALPPFYKSQWFFVLCSLSIIVIIIGIYSYLLRRQRKEAKYVQQIREAEMQTLRAQMNPHFMFNTLNSINSYIIQNKTEAASDYLTTFSKLMRSILEYSKEEFISLDNEMQALKLYMELESMRLEHSFDYTISIAKSLRSNGTIRIPPLIVQPFVENAIWHGLLHKTEPGNLVVSAKICGEDKLQIRVEDDGVGREKAKEFKKNQTHHKSYGIEITKQRLYMLHPENTVKIIDLTENDTAKGTAVIITIKL